MQIGIGTRVVKNPATWAASEFDAWGAGVGVGVVIEPPDGWAHVDGVFGPDDERGPAVDVRWPLGRCFQLVSELLPAPADEAALGREVAEFAARREAECDGWEEE